MKKQMVYAWVTGQDDNVGDSALRRGYIRALKSRGPVVAYIANGSNSYASGLGLDGSDRTESSLTSWLRSAIRDSTEHQILVALNAGEFSLSNRYTLMMLQLVPALKALKRRGAKVVWLGAAVPNVPRLRGWLFKPLHAASDLIRWRDEGTSEVFAPAPWMPDWALALDSAGVTGERVSLGVSLRFDRPYPSELWLEAVRRLAERLDLEIVVVAQVVRDTERAHRLARALGGRVVPFEDGTDHAEQERRVRLEYARMSLMISDRLHGLLIASTEGAVPLAWCEAATEKMARHFRALNLAWVVVPHGSEVESLDRLESERVRVYADEVGRAIREARDTLSEISDALSELS
ncbi:polysaccharide pyruvyl transferase family protein [Microbacterium sp.]|uniref:polysaccharide pyruvyl transferase family protein n=1 Tax=Microbacterium sp. TaxID=51671 RepID=UPI0039E5E2C9